MRVNPTNEIAFRQLLASHPEAGGLPDITTPEQWQAKRERIRERFIEILGEPSDTTVPPAKFEVLEESENDDYRHLKIAYEVQPGDEVRAHLLIPPAEKRNGAAVLCQHGTAAEGKDTQIGAGRLRGRGYGRLLARNGFITLSPDHICSGERLVEGYKPYDTTPFYQQHPNWSAVGKTIWDGQRALDILETLPEVDATRLGSVGHSLGAKGTLFLAAFDERVKASVASCGMTTWESNEGRLHWSRDHWYVYIPRLRPIFLADDELVKSGKAGDGPRLPVDLHEAVALVAPRAYLNISGLADETDGNNETLPDVGLQLTSLWHLLDQEAGYANFLFSGGHDVPYFSSTLTVGWFQHWLAPEVHGDGVGIVRGPGDKG